MPRVTQLVRVEQQFKDRMLGSRNQVHCSTLRNNHFSLGPWPNTLGFMQRLEAKGRLQPASRTRRRWNAESAGPEPCRPQFPSTRVPTAFQLPPPCPLLRPSAHPLALDSSFLSMEPSEACHVHFPAHTPSRAPHYLIKFPNLTISDPGYLKSHFIHLLNRGPLLGVPMALSSCDST